MNQRTATVERTTNETDIRIAVNLDGTGAVEVETGVPFFDHMLTAFGRHSLIDLAVRAKGDVEVDAHHTVEDAGIVLGQAVARALGDKRGIARFGSLALPMDEALVLAAVDISGRGQLHWAVDVPCVMLGSFERIARQGVLRRLRRERGPYPACAQLGGRERASPGGGFVQGRRARPAPGRRMRPAHR